MSSKTTMRAVGVRSFGKADKLEILEVPVPSIKYPGDILIKVRAVGLAQGDYARAAGYSRALETVHLPIIISTSFSGIVSAVGDSVTQYALGDEIYGFTFGGKAFAQYLLLSSDRKFALMKKPKNLSFEESASLPGTSETVACALLRVEREIPGGLKGKTVLVPAGLGGIGCLMLQLLKPVFGAGKVITTLSTAKVPLLSGLLGDGLVDQIVDYTKGDANAEIGLKTVDVLFDTSFLSMSFLPVMKPGTGVQLAFKGKSGDTLAADWPELPWVLKKLVNALDAWFKWRASRWGVNYDHAFTQFTKESSGTVAQWIEQGKIKIILGGVAEMDDLENVRKFYDIVATGKGAIGKYVVLVS